MRPDETRVLKLSRGTAGREIHEKSEMKVSEFMKGSEFFEEGCQLNGIWVRSA